MMVTEFPAKLRPSNVLLPTGDCDEAHLGRGLRRSGQPHFLQTQHVHVAGWRQEDVRRPTS